MRYPELVKAIHERRLITFRYDGLMRKAEPYTYGINKKGHEALSAFQVAGFSKSGNRPMWRLYLISEMRNLQITDETFSAVRSGYKRNDSRMERIFAQI